MKKRIVSFGLAAAVLLGAMPGALAAGMPDDVRYFGDSAYKIYTTTLSWEEAKEYCEDLGGHLATITSAEEQRFIDSLNSAGRKLWIGGYRDDSHNWYWVSGEDWEYTNWAAGEPNDSSNVVSNENRVAVWPSEWNDLNEDNKGEQSGFICEWPLDNRTSSDSPVSSGATPGATVQIPDTAVEWNGHYYQYYAESKSWSNAQAACEALGGHLVTITSQQEQSFLEDYISDPDNGVPARRYLIGLNRQYTGLETWVTGETVTYTNWGQGEPDNLTGRQYPVILNGGSTLSGSGYRIDFGQWDDDADSSYYYICEWDFKPVWEEASQWASPELKKAQEMDLIPEILYEADMTQSITRQEFAAVSVKTYEKLANTKALPATVNPFTDCSDTEVLKAYNTGIAVGTSDTTFEPNTLLNREQAAAMLTRVFKRATMPGWTIADDAQYPLNYTKPAAFADDANISAWAKDSVYFMAANNIIAGVGNNKFAPVNTTSAEEANGYANATREQALAIAVRMVENL